MSVGFWFWTKPVVARRCRSVHRPGAGFKPLSFLPAGFHLAWLALASTLLVGEGCSSRGTLPENVHTLAPALKPGHPDLVANGPKLFLKNCAHCHGADGRGNEGPDLHNLDWTGEEITARVRDGKKGQMTAFKGKLSADEIRAVIAYVRALE
jgi:mono/diheme cytochrome c family protein